MARAWRDQRDTYKLAINIKPRLLLLFYDCIQPAAGQRRIQRERWRPRQPCNCLGPRQGRGAHSGFVISHSYIYCTGLVDDDCKYVVHRRRAPCDALKPL